MPPGDGPGPIVSYVVNEYRVFSNADLSSIMWVDLETAGSGVRTVPERNHWITEHWLVRIGCAFDDFFLG